MAGIGADPFRAARLVLALRSGGVSHPGLVRQMETTDRSAFTSPDHGELAFQDCYLPIACGQAVLPPLVTGQILQAGLAGCAASARVLLVGAGSGYMAALMAPLCGEIVAAERYGRLAREAGARLADLGFHNVTVRHGDGLEGFGADGPYDRIVLTGSVEEVPSALTGALAPGGHVAAPAIEGGLGVLRIVGAGGLTETRRLSRRLQPLQPGVAAML